MDINSISQMYQSKLQDINSRLPQDTNVNNKFQSYLENAKLKNTSNEPASTENSSQEVQKTSEIDTTKLLTSLLTSNSGINSASTLFSSSTSNNLFPTSPMNNSLQMLQQTALLKALSAKTGEDK